LNIPKRISGKTFSLRPQTAGLAITIIISSFVFVVVARHIVVYSHYALHANRALRLAFDLKRGDLLAFLRDSYKESVYPPGAAWFESLFFLAFGASTVTARLFSLLAYVLAGFVLYALALELDERWGWLIGVAAVILFFTAQTLLVLAALSMLEMPGLLFSLLTLWIYLRRDKRSGSLVPVSLLATLTMLIKYPYGIVILGTLGLAELTRLPSEKQWLRAGVRRWAALFGPALVLLTLWFAGEHKVADFVYYATLQPKQTNWNSLDNLTYYPRSFSLHYVGGLAIALTGATAIIYAFYKWRQRPLRVLLLYGLVGTLIMTLKESNNPRFFATIAPAIYLLIGSLVAFLVGTVSQRRRTGRAYFASLGIGVMLLAVVSSLPTWYQRLAVYPALLEVKYETDPDARLLSEWISEQADQQRLYFINPWDQFSTFAMEWYLATTQTYPENRFGDVFVPDTRLSAIDPHRLEELEFQIRFYSTRYVVALEGGLEGQQIWPEYEQALDSELRPVASELIPLDFCNLDGWLKTASITRRSLSQAKAENCWVLNVKATMYLLLDPAAG
jgi:hypothetical protein